MTADDTRIEIDLTNQRLRLLRGDTACAEWAVSTAANGAGERWGSECTPRGELRVRVKIGHDCPVNTVFSGRRPTGEIYTPELGLEHPGRDWILTRILWLTGTEPGFNRGGDRDTLRRFIYIHGCPDSAPVGRPGSHGCIRMRNRDLIELFEQVDVGTRVSVREQDAGHAPQVD